MNGIKLILKTEQVRAKWLSLRNFSSKSIIKEIPCFFCLCIVSFQTNTNSWLWQLTIAALLFLEDLIHHAANSGACKNDTNYASSSSPNASTRSNAFSDAHALTCSVLRMPRVVTISIGIVAFILRIQLISVFYCGCSHYRKLVVFISMLLLRYNSLTWLRKYKCIILLQCRLPSPFGCIEFLEENKTKQKTLHWMISLLYDSDNDSD